MIGAALQILQKIFSLVWLPKNQAFFSFPKGDRLYLNLSSWLLKIKNLVCQKLANKIIKKTFLKNTSKIQSKLKVDQLDISG